MSEGTDSGYSDFYNEVGSDVFADMVHGFYQRVRTDDILGPMYPQDDWEGAERRLLMFLEQYWGGPKTYGEERGHPRLRMRHFPFPIDMHARDRWLEMMSASLDDIGEERLPENLRTPIWNHMIQVADMLINKHV